MQIRIDHIPICITNERLLKRFFLVIYTYLLLATYALMHRFLVVYIL
jgi:hypothetical protein